MLADDAVAAIQRAARRIAPAELFAAAASDGVTVSGTRLGNAKLGEVYADGAALLEAVSRGEPGAIGAALRGLARLDGEQLVDAALTLAADGKGELQRAAAFALARSQSDDALAMLLAALEPGSPLPRAALDRSVHPRVGPRVREVLVATGMTVFAVRARSSLVQWQALPREERRELDAMQPSGAPSHELQRAQNAIGVLGGHPDAETIELLVRMFEAHPDDRIRLRCAHALAAIDDPAAHAALDGRWADADSTIGTIAVRAALMRDPGGSWHRFLPHIQPVLADTGSPADEAITAQLLYALHGGIVPRKILPDPLVAEPRFIDLAARLRHHPRLGPSARALLEVMSREQAVAAIERYPKLPTLQARVALPQLVDHLARYRAGKYEAWDDLAQHALAIGQHAELHAEATEVANEIMARVRRNIDAIRAVLAEAGARVAIDDPIATGDDLARLERLGGPLPIALAAFYRCVGSIALGPGGEDRYSYGTCALECDGLDLLGLDPLELDGVRATEHILDDYESRVAASHPEIVGPLSLALARDFLHKQDISGGAPYAIELPPATPLDALDPLLCEERHGLRFVAYLRHALRWGGFPGLDVARHPLEEIDVNLRMPFKRVHGSWGDAAERLRAKLCRDVEPF